MLNPIPISPSHLFILVTLGKRLIVYHVLSVKLTQNVSYSPTLYHAVGRIMGPVDLAAIPIGSYEPRWHMHLQHTDPEGAVRMALQMHVRKSIGVHWGTWLMSDEACECSSLASQYSISFRSHIDDANLLADRQ